MGFDALVQGGHQVESYVYFVPGCVKTLFTHHFKEFGGLVRTYLLNHKEITDDTLRLTL